MDLRDYQEDIVWELRERIAMGERRIVVHAPTGAGKTVMAAKIIKMARKKGRRVNFCVPAISLIDQTVSRFAQNMILDVGVVQATHEMTDHGQPVQVCSVQTLMRRPIPPADLVIIDEVHLQSDFVHKWMKRPDWAHVPFIGLSATPWAKGMGKHWNNLLIGITTQQLIDMGHLSPFKVFAPSHPDLTGVKTVAGDYHEGQLAEAMGKPKLTADIVSTWLEKAERRPTLCFCVNRAHAKAVEEAFARAGVKTAYIDAFTEREERNQIERDFTSGRVEVVCNVGVLTTGIDWDVRCIILARPTKSEMLFVQIVGRGLRTAPSKDYCLILDHSDTTERLGFVTDIHHEELDDGKPKKKATGEEKKEKLPKPCPRCTYMMSPGSKECPSCGFQCVVIKDIAARPGTLSEILPNKRQKATIFDKATKQRWYSEMICYANSKGYKPGWAYFAYKDKFGENPSRDIVATSAREVGYEVFRWIKHRNIKMIKAREKAARASGGSSPLESVDLVS